ncbi:MAG TPA: aminopeptidase [Vicinamibacterales bacterium]|nr:aminopeptidase [Vicinamibacterales bacterium]
MMRPASSMALAAVCVASAMHLDWHFARPAHHRLSLEWAQHWLFAIPVFMFTGWYVCRFWPARVWQASVAVIGAGAIIAQVIEPLYELLIDGASFEWAFGASRQAAFASFATVGIVTHALTVLFLRRRPVGMAALIALQLSAPVLPYDAMAQRIVAALQVAPGERVLLRVDPNNMAGLAPLVQKALQARGAVVETLPYGPVPDFEARLARTDIYVWLPAPATATPPDQARMLQRWIDNGEGRELHFHWIDGTRDVDGLPAQHTPAYDRVYVDALDVDYSRLASEMDRAIQRLRAGEIRVTTPSGTDIRFRVGDRPFNKQDGDASKAHARTGRIRIDRHTELPAGILRVAPLEDSVNGVLVLPSARFGNAEATDVRLEFQKGVVSSARARSGNEALQAFLKSDPAASRFREFCLGFNPRLVVPPGETALPYYGYGSGVVRMSLGDNSELGGSVRGNVVRWLFFPGATVSVGGDFIVRDGKLLQR